MPETLHIVCPHCHTVNRIPAARLEDRPMCGKCRDVLFIGTPMKLTGANFDTHINNSDIPLLVDFWAPWCGPCQTMAPAFALAAETLEPRVRLAKVDTEAEQDLGGRFSIRSIPTLILFKQGREIARQPGAMSAQDIIRWTQGHG